MKRSAWSGLVRVVEISYQELSRFRDAYDAERLPLSRRYYDRLPGFARREDHYYAAHLDGEVAGFSALSRQRTADGRVDAVYHRSSYTRPRFRRRGIWSAIWAHKLRQIESRGWARPTTRIWVLTRPGDRRYRRRGFTLEGRCERRYGDATEPFLIWGTTWGELLVHPATVRAIIDDVPVHPPQPLPVRL